MRDRQVLRGRSLVDGYPACEIYSLVNLAIAEYHSSRLQLQVKGGGGSTILLDSCYFETVIKKARGLRNDPGEGGR